MDHVFLLEALKLALIQRGFCAPNPSVGAVIVGKGDILLATGYHHGPGLPHAEIEALNQLKQSLIGQSVSLVEADALQKQLLADATMYVTLEPCCHYGRTPPCTDALIQSGIKRLIYAYGDPNPLVAGKGKTALLNVGIDCQHIPLPEIDDFYQSYAYWHRTKMPVVTAKIAMTMDGRIAGEHGKPIKITGAEIHHYTHQQRKIHDAILTTIKTIIADDPQLNVRLMDSSGVENKILSKPLYILDRQLQLPLNAKIFSTAKSITLFHAESAPEKNKNALIAAGVKCIAVETVANKLNLLQVAKYIGQEGVHNLWIEAGGACFAAFIQEKLLNSALIYIAPKYLSVGQFAFDAGLSFDFSAHKIQWQQLGSDVLCTIKFAE